MQTADCGVAQAVVTGTPIPWYKRPMPLWTQFFRFLILLLLSIFILAAALLLTNARMPDPKLVRPLPDLLFDLLPKVGWLEYLTNLGIALLVITAVVSIFKLFLLERKARGCTPLRVPDCLHLGRVGRFIDYVAFTVIDSGRRPHNLRHAYLVAAIRFLSTYSVVMVYRALVIIMTSYPATDNHCQNPQVIDQPVLNMFLTLVTLGSGAIHCGDLMFSGHTIIIMLTFLLSWDYGVYIHPWALRVWVTVLVIFSFYCIIASRSHYTDDILVAAYSTVTTYLLIRHDPHGAPWQLQLIVRWWPWCGPTQRADATTLIPTTATPMRDDDILPSGQRATTVVLVMASDTASVPANDVVEDASPESVMDTQRTIMPATGGSVPVETTRSEQQIEMSNKAAVKTQENASTVGPVNSHRETTESRAMELYSESWSAGTSKDNTQA